MKSKLKLYYNTIKYMRKDQLFFRLKFRSKKFFYQKFNNLTKKKYKNKSEKIMLDAKISDKNFNTEILLQNEGSQIDQNVLADLMQNKFSFLNSTKEFDSKINWNDQKVSQLWNYNLHYFDYLINLSLAFELEGDKKYYNKYQEIIRSWIDNNPIGIGDAWHPYTVSLRLINWIKSYYYFKNQLDSDPKFKQQFLKYIVIQALYIKRNLEFDVRGNHLLENIRALAAASIFLDEKSWLDQVLELLEEQLDEQILKDGGHFERSPMYHSIVLYDLLEISFWLNNHDINYNELLDRKIIQMLEFLENILHPDKKIPLFNDSTFDIAKEPKSLFKIADNLGYEFELRSENEFSNSGYFIMKNKQKDFLIIDCGKVCPEYLPAHGHNDLLSYELSLNNKRVIVDTGVYEYTKGKWREYNRSTRAHNTAQIDSVEQSEMWGNFRIAERAKIIDYSLNNCGDYKYFIGGYNNFNKTYSHQRYFINLKSELYLIIDKVKSNNLENAKSFIHFDNEFKLMEENNLFQLTDGKNNSFALLPFNTDNTEIYFGEKDQLQGWYSPEFGKKYKNYVLELQSDNKKEHIFGYFIYPDSSKVKLENINFESKNFTITFNYNNQEYYLKEENDKIDLKEVKK
ncbi:heparinase II/III family protein [Halanaerobium congolense]|uniref:heparinase II/III family protein n=1 Tax=Halanaerobium congolense TaxID=54121 RepID=UPI00088D7F7F|nr:alginate lyase family protein [Halanaerobium congolense]SDK65545.1 Heparinase II/III N-terminus [Halanaerobium congolense]SDM31834.1 Heparinase II/III N-terminus [Halanaerobium congolense]